MPIDAFEATGITPGQAAPIDAFAATGITPMPVDNPSLPFRLTGDMAAGLASAGQGLHNFLSNALQPVLGKYAPSPTNIDFYKTFGVNSPNFGDELLGGIAQYAPFGLGGEVAGAEEAMAPVANRIAGLFGKVSSPLATKIAGQAPIGAVYGATQSQDPIEGAGEGALANTAGAALGSALPAVGRRLNPLNWFSSNLSPDEIQANLQAAQGTKTPIGSILAKPGLTKIYENAIQRIPFSGVTKTFQQLGQQITGQGKNLLDQMGGNYQGQDIPAVLSDTLDNSFKAANDTKKALYQNANDIANQSGLQLNLSNFQKMANDYSDAINSTNIMKFEPETRALFNKLQNYKADNPIVDGEEQLPSLQEASLLKGQLGNLAAKFGASPDQQSRASAGVFGRLAGALRGDINNSIEQNGSQELKTAYQDANKNYENNFAPFLDPNVYKFINGNADPDTLVNNFLKVSKNADRSTLLNKLMSVLPQEQQPLVGYHFLSQAERSGNFNPSTFNSLYQRLGSKQKQALFGNLQPDIENYSRLVSMNPEALHVMNNPPTGQRMIDLWWPSMVLAAYHAGGIPAAAATAVGIPGAGRLANMALTSPALRQQLAKRAITNQLPKPGLPATPINTLLQGLLSAAGGQ